METPEKRQIPTSLRTVLALDAYLTEALVKSIEKFLSLEQLKVYSILLAILCHGIPWLGIILILIQFPNNRSLYQMQVNLIMGIIHLYKIFLLVDSFAASTACLLINAVLVTALKAITKRRRPAPNNSPLCVGPDKYSFPSGHASRVAFIVYFFFRLWPISLIYASFLLIWSFFICMSRLLMRRHHILDVLVGILLGILEGLFINHIYLEQATCISLISWITN